MYIIEHLLHINATLNKAIKEVEKIKQWYTSDFVENSDKTKTFKSENINVVHQKEFKEHRVRIKFSPTFSVSKKHLWQIEKRTKINTKISTRFQNPADSSNISVRLFLI